MAQTVLRIRRYDPARDAKPYWAAYEIEAKAKFSVLDGLFAVLETQEGALGFRYSCRAGMCGSCAMRIDGREGLACRVRLENLGATVTVEPLRSLPVIKDLLTDMQPFFAKYRAVAPFFTGDLPSFAQAVQEPLTVDPATPMRESVNRAIDCISCGACFSACPTVAANPSFLGPAALNRAYALEADERDRDADRAALVEGGDGIYGCRSVGNCATVCPAGVEPVNAIRALRRRQVAAGHGTAPLRAEHRG